MQPIEPPKGYTLYAPKATVIWDILLDEWQPTTSRRDDMLSIRGLAIPAIAEAEQVYQGELY
jgi:hypothetical protein